MRAHIRSRLNRWLRAPGFSVGFALMLGGAGWLWYAGRPLAEAAVPLSGWRAVWLVVTEGAFTASAVAGSLAVYTGVLLLDRSVRNRAARLAVWLTPGGLAIGGALLGAPQMLALVVHLLAMFFGTGLLVQMFQEPGKAAGSGLFAARQSWNWPSSGPVDDGAEPGIVDRWATDDGSSRDPDEARTYDPWKDQPYGSPLHPDRDTHWV